MTRRTRVLTTTTAAVAMLAMAAPAITAQAATTPLGSADGVRYKKATVLFRAHESDPAFGATAGCDDGWKPVSGGQAIGSGSGQGISDSWPGQDSYWYSGIWRKPDVETRLTTFAVCTRNTDVTTYKQIVSDPSPNTIVGKDVLCIQGSAVSGTVFKTGDRADFTIHSSYPIDSVVDNDLVPDDGWRTYVRYTGDGDGDTVHFGVNCLEDTSLGYHSASATALPHQDLTTKALCPKGSPVLGGGVYAGGAATLSHLMASRPWDNKDQGKVPEDGWRGGIVNDSDNNVLVTVHAICRETPAP